MNARDPALEDLEEDLRVRVRDVPERVSDAPPHVVDRALPQAWLTALVDGEEGAADDWWATADGAVSLTLAREADTILLRGEGRFPLAHACVRCLEPVALGVDVTFDLRLVEGRAELGPDDTYDLDPMGLGSGEGEALGGDEDLFLYQGDTLKLREVVREQILLEVPPHPCCEDAGGPPCELDDAAEREAARWVDPRFAGLAALRDKLPQTSPAGAPETSSETAPDASPGRGKKPDA